MFEIQVILAVICATQTNDIYTRGLWDAWQRIRGSISGTNGRLFSPQQPDRLLRSIEAPTQIPHVRPMKKSGRGLKLNTHLPLGPISGMSGATTSLPLHTLYRVLNLKYRLWLHRAFHEAGSNVRITAIPIWREWRSTLSIIAYWSSGIAQPV